MSITTLNVLMNVWIVLALTAVVLMTGRCLFMLFSAGPHRGKHLLRLLALGVCILALVGCFNPLELRFINKTTDQTLVIIINPLLRDGTQGRQTLWHIPPGKDTRHMLPPRFYDIDGVYVQVHPPRAYKMLNGVTAVFDDCGVHMPIRHSNPIMWCLQKLSVLDAGIHDHAWIERHQWPRPVRLESQKKAALPQNRFPSNFPRRFPFAFSPARSMWKICPSSKIQEIFLTKNPMEYRNFCIFLTKARNTELLL